MWRRVCLVAVLTLAIRVPAASAEIAAGSFWLPGYPSISNAVAFDSVNQVYLMTRWDLNPLAGQFLDRNGSPIGGPFALATAAEGTFTAWSQVAFGGPPSDPVFLVTYLGVLGSGTGYVKYGRLVRYVNGVPSIGPATPMVNTGGQWQAQEKAQSVWFNDHFIVATRVTIAALAQPIVQRFEMSGTVSEPVWLGDALDFEGSPTLACAPDGTCLATGFAGGYPFNTGGAVWARLFDANTLQPIHTGLFYLDDHSSRMDEPWVVFNPVVGQFLTVWTQTLVPGVTGVGFAQFRNVSKTGVLGSYEHRLGDWIGNIALKFNAATGTALLATKWRNLAADPARWADLYAVEVDSNFRMTAIPIAPWDGSWNEYFTSIAADEVNGRWLVTSAERAGGRAALVSGNGSRRRTADDFDGSGARDLVVYRPSGGMWYMHNQGVLQWGAAGDVPVAGDYNGDGVTDAAVWRPSTGEWFVHNQFAVQWGWPGDVPVPGDYNGDGVTDLAVWRPSTGEWFVRGLYTVQWGGQGDVPIAGDYNGDGVTDVAVWRPSNSTWYVMNLFNFAWGHPFDVPVVADYNGDGVTDVALYRPWTGTWHVLGQFDVQWGWPEDMPVPGDYNGDGFTDIAVWRPSTGTWHVRGQFTVQWGSWGDMPVGSRLR